MEVTSPTPPAKFGFVNRVEEMERICDALKTAKEGKGQLLVIRGEAGSGKTRLIQEAATEAEKHGFYVGFGTSLAESVTPYHPWKEILEKLDLDAILDEAPPPRLLGVLCLTSEVKIRIKVLRKGKESESLRQDDSLLKSIHDLVSRREKNDEETVVGTHDRYRLVIVCRPTFSLAAILEGREDEIFIADMKELTKTVESLLNEKKKKGDVDNTVKTHLRQLIESEKYEGIDYTKDDPKLRQGRFFELVTLGLSRKADTSPLCVAIDDLQWADPSSLALLQYVSRNTRKSGVLLLGTYRIEEAEARPHLKKTLDGMKQEKLLGEMDLKGLSRKDISDLAKSFIGAHDLQDDFLDLLWQETQGNPLFVREVLKGLEEEGAIAIHGAVKRLVRPLDHLAIPERVREVIRTRLKRLPEKDRRLLDAAATCGTRFTAALVAKVAGEEEIKVLNGLRAIAKVHGLLRPVDSSFTFNHPAVQEVLYDGVSIETRRNYHREAAEWLELAGGPLEDIGEHYYRARDHRAVKRLQDAATDASAKYANDEAARLLGEALELASPDERGKLFERRGDALFDTTNYNESIESYKNALDIAKNEHRAAEIQGKIGKVCEQKGDYQDTISQCTQALNLVQGEGCREEAYILLVLGNAHFFLGNVKKDFDYYTKSLKIFEDLGDLQGISKTLNNIGNIRADRGDYENAIECYEKSLAISKEINNLRGVGDCFNNLGTVYRDQGDYENALKYIGKSIEIFEQIGDQFKFASSLSNYGEIHYRQGNFERSYDYSMKALGMSEKIDNKVVIASTLINIGNLYYIQKDFNKALDVHRRSLDLFEQIGQKWAMASVLNNIGTAHRELGEFEKAFEFYNKSLSLSEEMGERLLLPELYCNIAETHLDKGNLHEALKLCNMAFSLSMEIGQKQHIGVSRKVLGKIYRERKMWNKAKENFEESIRICREIGERFGEALSHYEFGLMWKRKGDVAKANECIMKAIEMFEVLKLPKRAAEVRKMLEAGT